MGSHSVTCHPTQVNAPRLTPTMQTGTRFTYPGGMEDWVDLVELIALGRESNQRPFDHQSDAEPLHHQDNRSSFPWKVVKRFTERNAMDTSQHRYITIHLVDLSSFCILCCWWVSWKLSLEGTKSPSCQTTDREQNGRYVAHGTQTQNLYMAQCRWQYNMIQYSAQNSDV